MTINEIRNLRDRVSAFIDHRRLRDAMRELKKSAIQAKAFGVVDKVEQAEQSYAYMLRYVSEGVNDPDRQSVYDNIVADLYTALDTLQYALEKGISPTLYFSTIRTREYAGGEQSIVKLLKEYAEEADKLSIFSMVAAGDADVASRADAERKQRDLFTAIWTSGRLSSDDALALKQAILDEGMSSDSKQHIISALMLALMHHFDGRKLELLMEAYDGASDLKVSMPALVGLLLGLWMYRSRPLPRKLYVRMSALKDRESWKSDLRIAFIEMIRARDTERINKKIQDELIPEMINLRPELLDKINDGQINPKDLNLEENPEWQEIMDKNGVTDKLKELTEMQMEGGDVMMSTFAHLKGFPFFYDLPNWFLPYSNQHTQVAKSASKLGVVSDMIEQASFLCDSDKYSFMMAIEQVPQEQRDLMSSQFKAQSENIYEAMSQSSTAPDSKRRVVNEYMQSIYRFFKLFRLKNEFFDPFNSGINLISVPILAQDFDDEDMLQVVAEFYFKLNYMDDALEVFSRMEDICPGDAPRYQKMGYCAERKKDYHQAIKYYQMAELLNADSDWTGKRLAACYRAIGRADEALKYYKALTAKHPDDLSLALLLGYVLTEKEDYAGAVKQFYKVEFMDEKSQKAWRPLAWTLFMSKDFASSQRYYDKIVGHSPKPGDYLNMGHVSLAMGDLRQAVNNYMLSVQTGDGDREAFVDSLHADAKHLQRVGVDVSVIPLVADAVFYALDK